MGHVGEEDAKQLREVFGAFPNEVKVLLFTQQHECSYCTMTREILEELDALGDKVRLEVYDFVKDGELADRYGVDKIPATVLLGEDDYGIRFYGVPAGYEFTTLIEDMLNVAKRDHELPPEVVEILAKVDRPVHLQVMVSPTCPVCPGAVRQAHRFAMASGHIRADMVETSEFPHLVQRYDVQGVPMTIINDRAALVGELPDLKVAQEILKTVDKARKKDKKKQKKAGKDKRKKGKS